ncbi:NAD(P)/FAD-dependent oxidoreductase [Microbulbifer sp.]|uniref:NAD(P)/FAD-dependent oxidoreductase n=1 Tax=Microbulbifer sp. TaxID=1908541 RepID=UPI003F2B362C
MNNPALLNSLWRSTAGEVLENTALNEDQVVDVVIIGGGFTGVTAALELAEKGASVTLLEADDIGYGGSGRNVGLVNAGLWMEPEKIEKILGKTAGKKINTMLAAGPEQVFSNIARFGIDCELTRTGTLHCAHSARGLANLKDRLRQYLARGLKAELLSREETAAKTGTSIYRGAIWHQDVGTIQPLAYVRGLARAAVSAGASVYQNSPVVSIERKGSRWRVRTPTNTVEANGILLATNAYHRGLLVGNATPQYTPVYFFQAATQPLSAETLERILPERQGCWNTATIMTSLRRDEAGRLIIGAVGNIEGASSGIHYQWAKHRLRQMFPYLEAVEFDHTWHGRIAFSADHLPHMVKFGPNALSIFGYSGRGIGPGSVFGKAAAEYLLGGNEEVLPIEPSTVYRESLTTAKSRYYELGATVIHGLTQLV